MMTMNGTTRSLLQVIFFARNDPRVFGSDSEKKRLINMESTTQEVSGWS